MVSAVCCLSQTLFAFTKQLIIKTEKVGGKTHISNTIVIRIEVFENPLSLCGHNTNLSSI